MATEYKVSKADELVDLARERFAALEEPEPSEAELKLLRAAAMGQGAQCGPSDKLDDPTNDPAKSDEWRAEREIRAALIRWLCLDREASSRVDPAGLRVLGAKITGELNLSFGNVPFPLGLFRCRLTETLALQSTQIPALLLSGSWTKSILADGVDVRRDVFLRQGFRAEGEVRLAGAQVGGNLHCTGGVLKNPPKLGKDGKVLEGSGEALNADVVDVKGSVFLGDGLTAEGEVRLLGAQIGGQLNCTGGTFKNPPTLAKDGKALEGSGRALTADGVDVKGDVFLGDGFTAEGEVRLLGAQIGGQLHCIGGVFKNPPTLAKDGQALEGGGRALSADGVDVKGDVLLGQGFTAEGEVRLPGAQIGGQLTCIGGAFKNPPKLAKDGKALEGSGTALIADGVDVKGDVFLRQGFTAEGEVRLPGAKIGGQLSCTGGTLGALAIQAAAIRGHFLWVNIPNSNAATLDVRSASAGGIVDEERSWPASGNLFLDGFEYKRISKGPSDAKTRLEWLARANQFTLQPYRQLAKVLREAGDERGAKRVLYEMERRLWRHEAELAVKEGREDRRWWARMRGRLLSWWLTAKAYILKITIGYGIYPLRVWEALAFLTALGFLFFRLGYFHGAMTPIPANTAGQAAYHLFKSNGRRPEGYPAFNSLAYSVENTIQVLRLGQSHYWAPDPSPQGAGRAPFPSPTFLTWFRWVQIVFGWVLVALFLAGVTGIAQRE